MNKQNTRGFTLLELMAVIVILGILAAVAYPGYQNYVKKGRLQEAANAMAQNAVALERHFAANGSFKKNSTTWADLPISQTENFCIRMQGDPKGVTNDNYAMKAVSKNKSHEPRVLIFNQDQTIQICESSTSTCSETPFFANPARADTECTPYH